MSLNLDCGSEILGKEGENGSISSPNYPNGYFCDLRCEWTLLVSCASIGFQMKIMFHFRLKEETKFILISVILTYFIV